MIWVVVIAAVVCLAFANGANDNFKGVASLRGSGTASYRVALIWATATTLLGSLAAVFFAEKLLHAFTGKGLVAPGLAADVRFAAAIALGAGFTVLVAARIGMPISTTHALVGALVGTGWAADSAVDVARLAGGFFLPLFASPLLAVGLTGAVYPCLHRLRRSTGITAQTCFCVGEELVLTRPAMHGDAAIACATELTASMGETVSCENRYQGRLVGVDAGPALDRLHFLSSGIVSFARGLNDTPKIAALLLLVPALGAFSSAATVGVAIAFGGLIAGRRVADTMSMKITPMNHGQGFTANVITGLVVIGASRIGVPVSTTHVSCGALFGIGAVTRQARWRTIATILVAWLTTLPTGAVLGMASFWLITRF